MKRFIFIRRFKAFTLAEVLITLGIIGVVAALTIPTLMANNQKTQYVTALQKAYSSSAQALTQMVHDMNCGSDLQCTGLFVTGMSHADLGAAFARYFKVVQTCPSTTGTCWATSIDQYYDGSSGTSISQVRNTADYKFITADGIAYYVHNFAGDGDVDCSYSWGSDVLGYMSQICGYIMIDVNAGKRPNYFGRDVFQFYFTNGRGAKLYPSGGIDDATTLYWNNGNADRCSSSSTGAAKDGTYCSGRIVEKNWQMDY